MSIEERAEQLGHKYARQYHHNNCFLEHDKSFVYSNKEITAACIEMAEDQCKIVVGKAFDWLVHNAIDDGITDLETLYESFRKAMED